jgi:hypothetical protein
MGNLRDVLLRADSPDVHWYSYPGELAEFLRYCVREHGFSTESVIHVVEKPWKWSEEYELWKGEQADV